MIKTVFFDLGNTIVDYHSGKLTDEEKDMLGLWRMHTKLKDNGIDIQFDELINTFYYPWTDKFSQRKEKEKEFNMLDFMPEKIKGHEGIFNFILEFHEPSARLAIPMTGVEDVLRKLKNKGIEIGIISNSPIPGQCHDMTLKYLNLFDFFSYRFYSYDLGMRKPNQGIFRHALRVSKTRENESMMVGDRLELDILPAQEIGMHALLYVGKDVMNSTKLNEWAISDFSEILNRIEAEERGCLCGRNLSL